MNVTTLIANPSKLPLTLAEVNSVAEALENQGAYLLDVKWLEADTACDIFYDRLPVDEAERTLLYLLANVPFDAITQVSEGRRKKLLLSDMDSTIITCECIDELADYAGIKDKVSVITERAMNGELDFIAALKERVALLKGLPETVLQECYDSRVKLMGGAEALVKTMAAHGATTVLISGGFTFFTARVAEVAGFKHNIANMLGIEDGKLNGQVKGAIIDKHAKEETLLGFQQELRLSRSEILAVGDGANDLPMLLSAGLGVAYHAKPTVRAQANAQINHCDLTALLYAQGFTKQEWACSI